MTLRLALAAAGLVLVAGTAQARSLYFIGDEGAGRWCVFPTATGMFDEERRMADRGVVADFILMGEARLDRSGAVQRLDVAGGPQSGDWAVTDSYRLKGGRIVSMRRVIGHADGSSDATLTFRPVAGRLAPYRQSLGNDDVPDWPVLNDLQDEPYYRMVATSAAATVPSEGICSKP